MVIGFSQQVDVNALVRVRIAMSLLNPENMSHFENSPIEFTDIFIAIIRNMLLVMIIL